MASWHGNNPIFRRQGVCDPHMHPFMGRMYVYCTHDIADSRVTQNMVMKDWIIVSSEDMVSWRVESCPRPEDTYIGPCEECWATDGAERNGKYYFYFSQGMSTTGVMVSDDPGRGFIDALGRPLLPRGLTPTFSYDPTVFTDDDGTPYIMFGTPVWVGGDSYYIARLNEDMISLAEAPRKVLVNDDADDKPSLHRYKDTYYLSWASHYATSSSVYGPYTYRGFTGASTDHGNFVQWRGQWFQAFTIFDPYTFRRGTGICYVHYRDNGEMVTDQLIREYGVGQYEGSWNKIEAEWYMEARGDAEKIELKHGGFGVRLGDGGSIRFPNVHDVPENAGFGIFAGVGKEAEGTLEIREKSEDGRLLGTCPPEHREDHLIVDYAHYYTTLRNEGGKTDLCLVYRGKGKIVADWFHVYEP